MNDHDMALIIRAKKLGLIIRDARLTSGKSLEECSQALGIPPAQFEDFEIGEQSPSLPEVEMLAYYLQLPTDRFWGGQTTLKVEKPEMPADVRRLVIIRQRIIGAILRQARTDLGLAVENLAQSVGIPPDRIKAYELGEVPIPLPEMEVISAAINRPLAHFQDQHGPIGMHNMQQRAVQDFLNLPVELQEFVSKPVNRPYLELAQRLSEMSVEKLRAVAEGLLEITL